MEFGQKIFREIDLFDFTIFFGLDFLKFFWSAVIYKEKAEHKEHKFKI